MPPPFFTLRHENRVIFNEEIYNTSAADHQASQLNISVRVHDFTRPSNAVIRVGTFPGVGKRYIVWAFRNVNVANGLEFMDADNRVYRGGELEQIIWDAPWAHASTREHSLKLALYGKTTLEGIITIPLGAKLRIGFDHTYGLDHGPVIWARCRAGASVEYFDGDGEASETSLSPDGYTLDPAFAEMAPAMMALYVKQAISGRMV